MSEYQYYDFVAIDEPLSPKQMAELRALVSRQRGYKAMGYRIEPPKEIFAEESLHS